SGRSRARRRICHSSVVGDLSQLSGDPAVGEEHDDVSTYAVRVAVGEPGAGPLALFGRERNDEQHVHGVDDRLVPVEVVLRRENVRRVVEGAVVVVRRRVGHGDIAEPLGDGGYVDVDALAVAVVQLRVIPVRGALESLAQLTGHGGHLVERHAVAGASNTDLHRTTGRFLFGPGAVVAENPMIAAVCRSVMGPSSLLGFGAGWLGVESSARAPRIRPAM